MNARQAENKVISFLRDNGASTLRQIKTEVGRSGHVDRAVGSLFRAGDIVRLTDGGVTRWAVEA